MAMRGFVKGMLIAMRGSLLGLLPLLKQDCKEPEGPTIALKSCPRIRERNPTPPHSAAAPGEAVSALSVVGGAPRRSSARYKRARWSLA
jgi:hypothetical protein